MNQWPPSPIVEDEITALSREHTHGPSVSSLKSEDDPAHSRGSVDQYPIIVDSDDQSKSTKEKIKKSAKGVTDSNGGSSSDDGTEPVTPPPVQQSDTLRPGSSHRTKSVSFDECPSITPQNPRRDGGNTERGRPQVAPIETNLGGDLHSMATGTRRAPSPYSYTRTPKSDTPIVAKKGPLLPSDNLTTSPVQINVDKQPLQKANIGVPLDDHNPNHHVQDTRERRHRSKSQHRSKSRHRDRLDRREEHGRDKEASNSSSDERNFSRRPAKHKEHLSPTEMLTKQSLSRDKMTPPHSRRPSKESYYGSGGEDRSVQRHSRTANDGQNTRQSPYVSPYTSSAEESSREHRHRQERYSRGHEYASRRRSSHRKERPRINDLTDNLRSPRLGECAIDDRSSQNREPVHHKGHPGPATPLTADAAKSMEDYFERAFKDNVDRRSRQRNSVRVSSSAVTSPLTSPPKTPTSERRSRDYFYLEQPVQRPPQRSRPPSMDEAQVTELKSHGTLLSAATAGAAMAARASVEVSRSGTTSSDFGSSNTTSKVPSAPRSRRPSPVFEDSKPLVRSGSYAPSDRQVTSQPMRPTPTTVTVQDSRQPPRGSVYLLERPLYPQTQRAFSYAGHEQMYTENGPQPGRSFDQRQGISSTAAIPYGQTTTERTRPVAPPAEAIPPSSSVLRLPSCPRSQPTVGQRDWYSIKDMPEIDICPTCMNVLGNTRFRYCFEPSLARPYNQPSVCAMSKPWLRIAFTQALKQGKPDLSHLRALSTLPQGTKPCAGMKPDLRIWFDMIDPATKTAIPGFVACSACVRAVDILFPELQHCLDRPKGALNQEKVCSLSTYSKHFPLFIDQIEQAAVRCKGHRWRSVDVQPLADHIRKATRYPECARDRLLTTRVWHFIPDLPEFTICEECFEEVVWPLKDRPIARDVSKTTRVVPVKKEVVHAHGISCQLYSDRMRKLFRDAVASRNFSLLSEAAKTRQNTQQRLTEMNKLYEQDQKVGIDRRPELERNHAIWRTME